MTIEQHFKTKPTATMLNLHEETVSRKRREGKIKAVKVGKHWLYPTSEINRILKNGFDGNLVDTVNAIDESIEG